MANAEDQGKTESNPFKRGPARGGLSMKQLAERQDGTDAKIDKMLDLMTGIVSQQEATAASNKLEYEMTEEDIASEASAHATDAKNNPAIIKKYTESEEQETGGAGDAELAETKDGEQFMSQSQYGDTTSPEFKDWFASMSHAHEKISIHVQATNEKDADRIIEIQVNGRSFLFERGKQYDGVPRYIVEGFLRAKPIQYDNKEYKDAAGLQQVKYDANRGLRYAVAMVNPTARDTAWFQHIQAQI